MKTRIHYVFLILALFAGLHKTEAQNTAFTYQGRLNDGANPANGSYDLRFALFDNSPGGSQQGPALTNSATTVSNGLFSVTLDFGGGVFNGASRWLEVAVRTNGAVTFLTLTPRQSILPEPYAIFAANAATSASYSGPVNVSQLPPSVALLNGNQVFTGKVSFGNPSNSFAGSGAGLSGVRLTQLNGENIITTDERIFTRMPTVAYAGTFPWSVATADVNGDGKPDVIVANRYSDNSLSVLTNDGTGGMALSATLLLGANPVQVVAADFNGDGKVDLVCASTSPATLSVFTNSGSGNFSLSSTPPGSTFVAVADVNGDGKVDLISGDVVTGLIILTNDGTGNFVLSATPGIFTTSVATGDVNGDGRMDLICPNPNATTLSVLTNDGTGNFVLAASPAVAPTGLNSAFVVAADVNGDGRIDLISANRPIGFSTYGSTVSVLTNDGSGGFVLSCTLTGEFAFPYNSAQLIASADLNGDGRTDLVCANGYTNSLAVLLNSGNGVFVLSSSSVVGDANGFVAAAAVAIADVNGDNLPDLLCASPTQDALVILTNAPVITFQTPVIMAGSLIVNGASTFNNPTNSFSGNGAGLTGLSAGNISSGTLSDARLSGNVVLRNANQTFTGQNTFSNTVTMTSPSILSFGTTLRQMLNLWGTQYAIGVQSYTLYFRTDNTFPGGGFAWYQGGTHSDSKTNSGGGITMMTLDNSGLRVNGTFVSASDRNLKENFKPISTQEILQKVAGLPLTRWNYKNDTGTEHLGPMAQDFYGAFAIGTDDKHITVIDEGGVALAAIQGLNQKVDELKGELKRRDTENAELKQQNKSLEMRLDKIEQFLENPTTANQKEYHEN